MRNTCQLLRRVSKPAERHGRVAKQGGAAHQHCDWLSLRMQCATAPAAIAPMSGAYRAVNG